ncbi:MAG: peptide ABC transporter substrate-binding protein [Anaerolineae bacterium]
MTERRTLAAASLLIGVLLAACVSRPAAVRVSAPPETVVVTVTAPPSPRPLPGEATEEPSGEGPAGPKVLNVCVVGEPDTLYLYGGSELPAARHVMEALYDGPIDRRDYDYEPVILKKLPILGDGDVATRAVTVREGDTVVDANGELVTLTESVEICPSGCISTECEVVFEEGSLRMDRMEVTFALREDVTWSDGEPLTAADSEFAFEVASDPATRGYRELTDRTADYKAVGEWRAKWTGVPGFMDPSYFLNFFPPLPRHQLEDRSPAELPRYDGTRRTPLGWGPFVVEEWAAGDHISLLRNPHYFRADESLPIVDRVRFRFAADAWDMVAALLSGECDVATHDPELIDVMPFLVRAEERGLLQVVSAPGAGWEHISFNLDPVAEAEGPAPFADVRVRQAVARCVDRRAIVDEVTHGRSVVPDSTLPPGHWLYPEGGVAQWAYDPAAGRAVLDEVGWRDEDGDGVREAHGVEGVRDGETFDVTLLAPWEDAISRQTARIVRAQLADCGIRVAVEERPRWELLAPGPEGPVLGRRFDLAEGTWWLGEEPSCERYVSWEVPGSEPASEGNWEGVNVTGYRNPLYDEVCRSARGALRGTEAFERYHREAQIIFSHHLPALPLFMRLRVGLGRPEVENFRMDATAASELWNVETLDIGRDALSP